MAWLTRREAAAALGTKPKTLSKWAERGKVTTRPDPSYAGRVLYWVGTHSGEIRVSDCPTLPGDGNGGGRVGARGEDEGSLGGQAGGDERDSPGADHALRHREDRHAEEEEILERQWSADIGTYYTLRDEHDTPVIDDEWEEKTPTLLHTAGVQMWVVVSDVHVPEHDRQAWQAALDFIADWRPHGVVINGDFAELQSFSSHGDLVNPGYWREERDAVRRELSRLRRAAGNARIVYNAGNHESRLERSQSLHSPAVVGADPLPAQLGLDDLDIEWRKEGLPLRLGHLRVVHGKWAPINAAKKHLEKLGSCLVGHVHRPGMHAGGYDHKTQVGWVAPCLRDLDANYLRGYDAASGWAHGFAVCHVWPDDTFNCELIVMTPDRRFAYGGRVYG